MPRSSESNQAYKAIPADAFTFDQLAPLYNETRVDYIVPMPMTGRRLAEYVHDYDISLSASAVIVNSKRHAVGLTMIGLRGDRAWATRLGVLPQHRGHKVGQFLMENLIQRSREHNTRRVQLEVIKGNEPAMQLFLKLGFVPMRELLIIRRPPGPPPAQLQPAGVIVSELGSSSIESCLAQRDEAALAWTEETPSLLRTGGLRGLTATLPSGESGWVIFQHSPFQLLHLVLGPGSGDEMTQALLYSVHQQFSLHDTKVENLPSDHKTWPTFQRLGYMEVFRRVEMYLSLLPSS